MCGGKKYVKKISMLLDQFSVDLKLLFEKSVLFFKLKRSQSTDLASGTEKAVRNR